MWPAWRRCRLEAVPNRSTFHFQVVAALPLVINRRSAMARRHRIKSGRSKLSSVVRSGVCSVVVKAIVRLGAENLFERTAIRYQLSSDLI
jgi:hypothetical protein